VAVDALGGFLYAANINSNNISAYKIGENGTLTPVAGSPFAAGILCESVAVAPLGRYVYAANEDFGGISAFRIGESGALSSLGAFFSGGTFPVSVVEDLLGRFVFVTNSGFHSIGANVSAFSVGKDGALTPVTGSPILVGSFPVSVAVSP
jgi:6-phosphogluconolactonase (cycloisomerase 2 family)